MSRSTNYGAMAQHTQTKMLTIRPLTAGRGVVSNSMSAHHSMKGVTYFVPVRPSSLRHLAMMPSTFASGLRRGCPGVKVGESLTSDRDVAIECKVGLAKIVGAQTFSEKSNKQKPASNQPYRPLALISG